jgi:hypothetical protein
MTHPLRHLASRLVLLVLAGGLWTAPLALAQEEMTLDQQVQFVRSLTAAERQATLAAAVQMTTEESDRFWPLYRSYRTEVASLDDRTVTLIKDFAENYASLTDEKASAYAREWLDVEKKRLSIKDKYVKKYAKVLPGTKLARVLQVENRLDLLTQLRLARNVPLVRN